jgi:hypothetical protein
VKPRSKSKILDSDIPNASEIREEILGEFSLLFAEDGSGSNPDELDFFECRFNLAFRSFWIDPMRRETARVDSYVQTPGSDKREAQSRIVKSIPFPNLSRRLTDAVATA